MPANARPDRQYVKFAKTHTWHILQVMDWYLKDYLLYQLNVPIYAPFLKQAYFISYLKEYLTKTLNAMDGNVAKTIKDTVARFSDFVYK